MNFIDYIGYSLMQSNLSLILFLSDLPSQCKWLTQKFIYADICLHFFFGLDLRILSHK
jgi:hypothetical protein